MAPVCLFCFVLFSHLVLILSAGHEDKCPHSFACGRLGLFQYPFTMAELPHCGLLPIQDCNNASSYPKKMQLEKNGRIFELSGVAQPNKIISIFDEDFHTRLEQDTCDTLKNNYSSLPPPSPLVSFYIEYNVTLFRCNHHLNTTPPPHYNKKHCSSYNIYYDKNRTSPSKEDARTTFSSCSVVRFASKDVTDTKDILSFVSAEMIVEVVLSHDCDECFNRRGGQCRLDTNDTFYCDKVPKDKSKALKLGLGLGIGLGIILLCISIIGCFFRWRYRIKHAPSKSSHTDANDLYANPDPESGRDHFGIPLFSYKELKEATNNFHHGTQLGSGGFGTVYYGKPFPNFTSTDSPGASILSINNRVINYLMKNFKPGKLRDGREVAVKRLYEHNYRRQEQFTNEIQILTRMRHRNLVSLYGCTSRHSHELLLVYEYVPNGTVACHLHGDLAKTATLPWHTRMKIAIETACSLSYLHASDIIHRDVKTNNILLDDNYTVKVADFGLSRLFPSDVTHVSTAPQGTPGYVDPEYYRCYQLTNKSDVYSFGVVLIELISSKPAVDMSRHKDEINLSDLAIKKIQNGAISELVDPSLGFDSDNEVKGMIVSVAELAFQCLQRDRELRPSMNEVLKVLVTIESLKDKAERVEEVDVHSPPSPPSPDLDGTGLLKNMMMLSPSPKAVTDRWNSESTTPNVSG